MPGPKSLLALVNVDETRELVEALFDRGHSKAEVLDQITELADAVVKWPAGKVGDKLEAADGAVIRFVLRFIVGHVARRRGAG